MQRLIFGFVLCTLLVAFANSTEHDSGDQQQTSHDCEQSDRLCAIRRQLAIITDELDKFAEEKDLEENQKKQLDVDKRKSTYVRFGKRDDETNNEEKRKSAYVRFGRSATKNEHAEK